MTLPPGTRLGSYEVVGPLGSGGMGEVYRARDTELKREVALKVLPDGLANDVDRVSRFQREAELLATLNHPHIAAIYGLFREGTTTALALELVEGETLAERIARAPIADHEALRIALQIVSALAGAHERGIIHRDLKPANIKIRPDGTVKVLDFGLAKALDPAWGPVDAALSPTLTSPAMTVAGVILGTAAYMSPEQARGHAADERSDIWSFGCVLFEMLAGQRAFQGDTVAETLASVLRTEQPWAQLPADTSRGVKRLVRRCLQKDPSRRLADIRDARWELEETEQISAMGRRKRTSRTRERLWWSATLVTVALALGVLAMNRSSQPDTRQDFSYLAIPETTDPAAFALAPDGRQAVFVASLRGRPQLWHYSFDTGQRRPLRGTADAAAPFWSPNNQSIGFFRNERLYVMQVEGGAARELTRAAIGTGGTWSRDDVILFTPVPDAPVVRVNAKEPSAPTELDGPRGLAGERFPQFLPDEKHFIYYKLESRQVFVGSTDSSARSLLIDGVDAAAVVAPPDRVLFVRGGQLLLQRIDLSTWKLVGEARMLATDVAVDDRGAPAVSASANGAVLYRTGPGNRSRRLLIVDRKGVKVRDVFGPDPSYPVNLDLCPGAQRVVLNRSVGGNTGIDEIEINRGIPTTLTTNPLPEILPICSARGITFGTLGAQGIIARLLPGAFAPISVSTVKNIVGIPLDEAPDGTLLYRTLGDKTGWDIQAIDPAGTSRLILGEVAEERSAQFSPDGKWFAYESNEVDGVFEIFVRPYPNGGKKRVSFGGGSQPRWEGDEIFYVAADGQLTAVRAVPASDGADLQLLPAVKLFPAQLESTVQGGIGQAYAVFPGGQQFLLSTFTELPAQALTIIRNVPR